MSISAMDRGARPMLPQLVLAAGMATACALPGPLEAAPLSRLARLLAAVAALFTKPRA